MTKESKRITAYLVLIVLGVIYLAVSGDSTEVQPMSDPQQAIQAEQPSHGAVDENVSAVGERLIHYSALDCKRTMLGDNVEANEDQRKQLCRCVHGKLVAQQQTVTTEDDFVLTCAEQVSGWAQIAMAEVRSATNEPNDKEKETQKLVDAIPEAERTSFAGLCKAQAEAKASALGVAATEFIGLNHGFMNECILNQSRGGAVVATPQTNP